jgi:hypothetical protein
MLLLELPSLISLELSNTSMLFPHGFESAALMLLGKIRLLLCPAPHGTHDPYIP